MALHLSYAQLRKLINSQVMFSLLCLGACGGIFDEPESSGGAGTQAERVHVTRAALGSECTPSAVVDIDTCQELQNMELDLCGQYRLIADIDCSSFDAGDQGGFRPIGTGWPWEPFGGSFDGNGHVITGLTIDRPSTNFVALFGCLADSRVERVGLENVQINGAGIVGALAGVAYATQIDQVYATGSVTVDSGLIGGLVGWVHDEVAATDLYSHVAVTTNSDMWCAMAFGKSQASEISRVYAAGMSVGCTPVLIGAPNGATVVASFFDCTVAGNCTADGAETTTTMQAPSHYSTAGWDLTNVWGFNGPNTYPCLLWEDGCGCQETDETCNGVDDDCSGQVDEDFEPVQTACGAGACTAQGVMSCDEGNLVDSCQPPCEGACADLLDDDLDTAIDCADSDCATDPTCIVVGSPCEDAADCSALGNDAVCFAGIARGYCSLPCEDPEDLPCPGGSVCAGAICMAPCEAGACSDDEQECRPYGSIAAPVCWPQCPEHDCLSGTGCNLATGACQSCSEVDDVCDGLDGDCDGSIDEDYVAHNTSCGVGACAAFGSTSCLNGSVENSCLPGSPAANDTTCDSVDDDCDGDIDDGFVAAPTSCGVGACARSGALICAAGHVSNSCTPGNPAASDTSCNGVDNDCNGATDEDYASCSNGTLSACVGGAPQNIPCSDGNVCNGIETCSGNACTPGTPLVIDDSVICTADSCHPVNGVQHIPLSEGTPCDDGEDCTEGTTCDEDVECTGGTVVGTIDDQNPCTLDTCDPELGAINLPLPNGSSCADGTACNGAESCFEAICIAGAALNVDDDDDCTADSCDPIHGAEHELEPTGTACDDGNDCTVGTTCGTSGACGGGTTGSGDDGDPCTADSCDAQLHRVNTPLPTGTSCADGNVCNGVETCLAPLGARASVDPREAIKVMANSPSTNALAPTARSLVSLGLAPGDRVELMSVGSFALSEVPTEPTGRATHAVFSTSSATTVAGRGYLVTGRIACDAPSYVTENDIAEDFAVPTTGVVVTVPPTATHLFVAASDSASQNNTDTDGDFGFRYRVVNAAFQGPGVTHVNPRSTFLRRVNDPGVLTASALSLAALGVAPGDQLDLHTVGEWTDASSTVRHSLIGAFSTTNVILDPLAPARIPGAVASSQPAFVTPSDIATDFLIPHSGVTVTVPANANYLFVGANVATNGLTGANVDADYDFGLVLREHVASASGCTAGVALEIDDEDACTTDTCDPIDGVEHSSYSQGAQTCAELGAECGAIDDGCGSMLDCGTCTAPEVCGQQQANRCDVPALPVQPRIQIARAVNMAALTNGGSIIEPALSSVNNMIDSRLDTTGTAYTFATGTGTRFATIRLGGSDASIIDQVSLDVAGPGGTLSVSATDIEPFNATNLVPLAQITVPLEGYTRRKLSFLPTRARFVRITYARAPNVTEVVGFDEVNVLTRSREGGVVSLYEGGAHVLSSSATTSQLTGSDVRNVINYAELAGWRSLASLNPHYTVRLSPLALPVDQLEIQARLPYSLRAFDLDLSPQVDGTGLQEVLSAQNTESNGLHTYSFAPTVASSARLRDMTPFSGPEVAIRKARLYSQRFGGAAVPFNDVTPIAAASVATRLWNFGDGQTSTAQYPLHTYAAPGTYAVSLAVTDTAGRRSTTATTYTVLDAPVTGFEVDPVTVQEGGGFYGGIAAGNAGPYFDLVDRSSAAHGHQIVERTWSSVPAATFEGAATVSGTDLSTRFMNDGTYAVTLRVVDSQLLTATTTQQVYVANVPPIVEAGGNVTGIWGLGTRIGFDTFVADQGREDNESLWCRWSFGDGQTLDIPRCAFAARQVVHTYADPGTYTATLTAYDDDTSTSDTIEVLQHRHFTAVVPQPLVATAQDGVFIASAQLIDSLSDAPLAGMPLRIALGGQEHVVTTNAQGFASAPLQFEQLSYVTVEYSFAGTTRYQGSQMPMEYVVRDGDTEPQPAAPPPSGQEANRFVLGFTQNAYDVPSATGGTMQANFVGVLLTSRVETDVTVSAPGLSFSRTVQVVPGKLTAVDLPVAARMGVGGNSVAFNVADSGRLENKGVEIESDQPISVYGFNFLGGSADGFNALPLEQLGREHIVLAYPNEKQRDYADTGGTEIGIIASEDDTLVTITPSADVAAGPQLPSGARKDIPFTVELDRLQTFQIATHSSSRAVWEDLTGTHVSSTKPVAVFGGHACATVGGSLACNHLVEQMPPVDTWGTRFITVGVSPDHYKSIARPNGSYLRVLASVDGTQVRVDGELVRTLRRGEHAHLLTGLHEAHEIITSAPALVAIYGKSVTIGASNYGRQDPFMMLIPAVDQFATHYDIAVAGENMLDYIADQFIANPPPGGVGNGSVAIVTEDSTYWDDNRLAIIAPVAEVGGIRVDGAPVSDAWFVVGTGDYAVSRVKVPLGHHRVSHAKPGVRFGVLTYGYQLADAFGYGGGIELGPRECRVSVPRPADGIDNDCDGIRDEEHLNGIDDDGDGVEDEDLSDVTVPNRAPIAYPTRWTIFNAGATTAAGGTSRTVTERFALPAFDADGDALAWTLISASRGTASLSGNVVTFTDNLRNTPSSATLQVRASDGQATSNTVSLAILSQAVTAFDDEALNACETRRAEGVLPTQVCNEKPYVFADAEPWASVRVPSGQVVHYAQLIHGHDWDRDLVQYELTQGPPGMTVGSTTGKLTWNVDSADIGTHTVRVRLSDVRNGATLSNEIAYSYNITVNGSTTNQLPIISSTPATTATAGALYSYQIVATDPENTALTYALLDGPQGMTVSSSGLVSWRPTSLNTGAHSAIVRVTDAGSAGQSQPWSIQVGNSPLRITSSPPLQAGVGSEYHYAPTLIDDGAGSGPYTWTMRGDSPAGLRLAPQTGEVHWTPNEDQQRAYSMSLQVEDTHGNVGRQYFTVKVEATALAPRFFSDPVTETSVGALYLYNANAEDFGHRDVLTYSLVVAPPGMTIDPLSGVIQWIPAAVSSETVSIRVTDSSALSDLQTFVVSASPDETAPVVRIVASTERVDPGQPITLTVVASDNAAVESRTLEIDGVPHTLNGSHQYVFTSSTPGVYTVTASATDPSDNVATAEITIGVEDATDTSDPVVVITSPQADDELTYIHDIVASATDANLMGYRIELRRAGSPSWHLIRRGYAGSATGVLGRIDTTRLQNGYHELRITAEDVNGRTRQTVTPVRIAGQAKVGTVQLDFVDAVIPMAGIPIVLTRSYDSRKLEKGDFGYGWSIGGKRGSITHNRALGHDWFVTYNGSGPFAFPCQVPLEHLDHYTEVRLSEREWWLFKPVLIPRSGNPVVMGNCQMSFTYVLVDGVNDGAQLFVNDITDVETPSNNPPAGGVTQSADLWYEGSSQIYNPQSFILDLTDGREVVLDGNGIQSITDANDNTVFFASNGIAHSGGSSSIFFERDLQGRIARVTDPLGRSVEYGYDLNGDLVRVIDPIGRVTRFSYDPDHPHQLDRIIGDDGREISALQYDEDGRLAGACQPDAGCNRSEYDLTARTMTQRDATGIETEYAYDVRGNVTSQTDALGNTVEFAYDANDNLTRAEGPDGSVATYAYDGDGNMTSRVLPHEAGENAAHFTYTYGYNARGDRETVTLPSGGVIDYDFDANGNMTAVKDGAAGVIESRTYNANGTLDSRTDRFGIVSSDAYNNKGQVTEITDPFGQLITLAYDTLGRLVARTERGVTTTWEYDAMGRPTAVDYGTGATVEYEYRSKHVPEWTAIQGPTFGRVERTFTSDGKVRSWTEPNGDVHTRLYNPGGRIAEEIDPLGNRTIYAYDAAGRLASITDFTLEATTTFERDDAGRVVSTTDALGNETATEYQVGGRLASTTNARGYETSFGRTPTQSSITDALTRTTVTSVTQYGLPTGTSYPGGASTGSAFRGTTRLDGAQSFPTSFEDELSRERSFDYDTRSGLTSATDLAGAEWSYSYAASAGSAIRYDVFSGEVSLGHHDGGASAYGGGGGGTEYRDVSTVGGNDSPFVTHHLSQVTSPTGETTRFIRGEGGRIESILYPDGGEKEIAYDDRGLPTAVTLPQGTALSFEHDAALREISRESSAGEHRAFAYGPGDRIETMTDDTGATNYDYDPSGRFIGIEYPDGGLVRYTRDKLGRTTAVSLGIAGGAPSSFTQYAYDENGNLEQLTLPTGIVSYVYDDVDRLVERTLPNGVTTTYTYDARDRVLSVVHETALGAVLASVEYTRSASGEPIRIEREDGSYVTLTYDEALRVEAETYYNASDTVLDAIEYTYDADGNRTSKTSLTGGFESYSYGDGFQLDTITKSSGIESYGYDGGGRQVTVTRGGVTRTLEYNSDDKLTRVLDGGVESARYEYDGAGRRVGSVIGGVERKFYVAPNVGDGFESPQIVLDGSGAAVGGYAYAGEQPVAKWTAAGWEYYLQDAMGSVIGMASAAGSSTASIKYDSFGNVTSAVGASANIDPNVGTDFRYHGMQLDAASGLYHVRARTYDARTGRFTGRDPVDGITEEPERYNPYVYGNSNLHLFADPTGEVYAFGTMTVVAVVAVLAVTATAMYAISQSRARSSSGTGNPTLPIADTIFPLLEHVGGVRPVLRVHMLEGGLIPFGSPMTTWEARRWVVNGAGRNVWTFNQGIASIVAGSNAEGPELHTERAPPGAIRFWHYHLGTRTPLRLDPARQLADGHIFYGSGVRVE